MVYDDDTGRHIHHELDDEDDVPGARGRVRIPREIQREIVNLADRYDWWYSANSIHAELNVPGLTVDAVRYVLNQYRPKGTRRP